MSEEVVALGCGYNVSFHWPGSAEMSTLKLPFYFCSCVPTTDYRRCILHVRGIWADSNLRAAHELLITHLCICVFVSMRGRASVFVCCQKERERLSEDVKHPQLPLASSCVNNFLFQMQCPDRRMWVSRHSALNSSFVIIWNRDGDLHQSRASLMDQFAELVCLILLKWDGQNKLI